jgi:hypothetical protein
MEQARLADHLLINLGRSEVLKLDPKMTVEKLFSNSWPYGQEHRERQIAAMHKAGLK